MSSGASSSQYLHDVRDGDRPDTVRAPEPHGGKDVSVCYVTWTIDSTRECAALYDVHDFFLDIDCHITGIYCDTWTVP